MKNHEAKPSGFEQRRVLTREIEFYDLAKSVLLSEGVVISNWFTILTLFVISIIDFYVWWNNLDSGITISWN